MDEILFFTVVVVFILLLVPIIILVKISHINRNIDNLRDELSSLSRKIDVNRKTQGKEETVVTAVQDSDNISVKETFVPPSVIDETVTYTPEPIIKPMQVQIDDILPLVPNSTFEQVDEVSPSGASLISERVEELPPAFDSASIYQRDKTPETEHVYYDRKTEPKYSFLDQVKEGFGKIFGDNILTKIGVITLVLGIGFFVKYAIDQEWINEIGRVGIGLFTGALLIGVAHKFRKDFHVFSSILVGGGIAVFYITITLAFREYGLFSQTIAFVLLVLITAFSVVLSLLYDRKELAIFSLLGAYASPLMVSTGAGNYIVLFSYFLIVNSGMLCISFVKKWRIVGIIAYVLTLVFFWGWLSETFTTEFGGAIIFASLFFIQFYLLAIIDHSKSQKHISVFQVILIITNNLSLFLSYVYITNDSYLVGFRGLFTVAIALVNAAVLLLLYRKSTIDRNLLYLVIGVVLTFISLAVPMQLNGYAITMFWAVEMVILLWVWQRSKIQVFRLGFLVMTVLVLISYMMDVSKDLYDFDSLICLNRMFITGSVVIFGFVFSSFLLRREDSAIQIGNFDSLPIKLLRNIFYVISVLLIFIVPYQELSFQIDKYALPKDYFDLSECVRCTYFIFFMAVFTCVKWNVKRRLKTFFNLFLISIIAYLLICMPRWLNFRANIFIYSECLPNYFLIHFIDLLSLSLIMIWLCRNIRLSYPSKFTLMSWILVIFSVIILSQELDNIVIILFANPDIDNYHLLLYDVHTFGYPILWGLLAFVLMIWGIKRKVVVLRKISLIFFAIIIVKFYAYDVWRMSQAGRIVSFVALGVILILVSFMQQKIKTLVKSDKNETFNDSEGLGGSV